ncbi:MAG: SH3 domain-containing protein [Treponema sp.]|nr:SH3 domain-containing protein [Treponema sp.]
MIKKKIIFILIGIFLVDFIWSNEKDISYLQKKFSTEKYVIEWYVDVLKQQNRDSIHDYTDIHVNKTTSDMDGTMTWIWYKYFEPCILSCFYSEDYNSDIIEVGNLHYFLIFDCYKENEMYYIKGKENKIYKNKHDKVCPIDWTPVRQFDEFFFILAFDGDFINIYYNEVNPKNLFATFCYLDDMSYREFNNLISYNKCDLSKVTWPRHADGSCDYDGSKKTPAVQTSNASSSTITQNQTMTVTENLKLRSGEATSTQVLTVMAAGTKVKILELGHSETIDGITSNWVKVELLAGAIDRDGKPIKAGTVGWCYGGYLK